VITTNVLQRTFYVKVGNSTGTCFTIDVNDKQYLVTARHVVENISKSAQIDIFHEHQWKTIEVALVGHCTNDIDISVLSTNIQISSTYGLEPSQGGIIYGQDVYFLGFPYGMAGEVGGLNRDFPLPFVKKAILSCTYIAKNGSHLFYLDGHNNPGFSGGPVVFREPSKVDLKIAAVVSGYRYVNEPIFYGAERLPLEYRYNTGIVICYGIKHAVDLIHQNPIGYALSV
jgi:S1-C subfamily serine protease